MIILGTNSVKDTGYDVANSCRFNDDDNAKMSRDISGSPTNPDKYTISFWIKRAALGNQVIFGEYTDTNNRSELSFSSGNALQYYEKDSGSATADLVTNKLFRDVGAWYNIVFAYDSSQGTDTNRVKFFINGSSTAESLGTTSYPSQNVDSRLNKASLTLVIGQDGNDAKDYDGYLAEAVLCDGQAYTASDFGEFDEDSPTIWKPKDVSGLTFGDDGFYLDFEASDNLGNDANGGTDFTESNLAAADQATDTPTNNFATLNPLDNFYAGATLSEGNLLQVSGTFAGDSTGQLSPVHSTIGVSSGKWYSEVKFVSTTTHDYGRSGVTSNQSGPADATASLGYFSGSYGYFFNSGDIYNGNGDTATSPTYGSSVDVGDIIGMYLDLDNNKLYFADNGTLVSSTGISITAAASTNLGSYFFGLTDQSRAAATFGWNFGGCSAFTVSSGNTDVNGYGNFEYDPSSGTFDGASKNFLALCTKNLAEHG